MSGHQVRISSFLARSGFVAGFRTDEPARCLEAAAREFRLAVGAAALCFAVTVLADRSVVGFDFGLLWPAVLEGSGCDAAFAARASLRRRLLR